MNTGQFDLTLFLSAPGVARLSQDVAELVRAKASTYVGFWDANTLFAVVVEVVDGAPIQWHVRGPLNRQAAEYWLAILREEIEGWRPPTTTSH